MALFQYLTSLSRSQSMASSINQVDLAPASAQPDPETLRNELATLEACNAHLAQENDNLQQQVWKLTAAQEQANQKFRGCIAEVRATREVGVFFSRGERWLPTSL